MSAAKYADEIRKTGFVLEHKVSHLLQKAGWTVISNKYYEDDFEGNVREIDLLAYKIKKVQKVNVYTTLLISCKKSESDIWALLSRKINIKDPNSDWWPLHVWSNDFAIAYEMAKSTTPKEYHERVIDLGVLEALSIPAVEVFAFQEMSRVNGAPKNDKAIFSSITSLLKAQAYEIGALPKRKKDPSVYQFNLISVVDSDLIRLVIDNDEITQEEIEEEHYISRYIIKRGETFSRIRFISFKNFEKKIKDYKRLHDANGVWFGEAIDKFFCDVLKDPSRVNILLEIFQNKIWWPIYVAVRHSDKFKIGKNDIYLGWDKKKDRAVIYIKFFELEIIYIKSVELEIDLLNENAEIKSKVAVALKNVYRYEGEFVFEVDDVPF